MGCGDDKCQWADGERWIESGRRKGKGGKICAVKLMKLMFCSSSKFSMPVS